MIKLASEEFMGYLDVDFEDKILVLKQSLCDLEATICGTEEEQNAMYHIHVCLRAAKFRLFKVIEYYKAEYQDGYRSFLQLADTAAHVAGRIAPGRLKENLFRHARESRQAVEAVMSRNQRLPDLL